MSREEETVGFLLLLFRTQFENITKNKYGQNDTKMMEIMQKLAVANGLLGEEAYNIKGIFGKNAGNQQKNLFSVLTFW